MFFFFAYSSMILNQYLMAIQRMNLTTVIQSLTRTLPVAAKESEEEDVALDEDIDDDLRLALGYECFIIVYHSKANYIQ